MPTALRPILPTIMLLAVALASTRSAFAVAECGDGFCDGQGQGSVPYVCWDAVAAKGAPKFTPIAGVEVEDAYEDLFFTVTGPREICNPGSHDEFLPETPTHLVRYELAVAKKTPRNLPKHVVAIDELGTITVDAIAGDKLMVPAAKSLFGPPQTLEGDEVDHFKCYDVKPSKGAPKLPKGIQIALRDQFGAAPVVWTVVGPAHLCPVARKNDEPVLDPCAALVCYDVVPPKGTKLEKVKAVYIDDQLGPLKLDVVDKDEVCVPATIVDGERTVCLGER